MWRRLVPTAGVPRPDPGPADGSAGPVLFALAMFVYGVTGLVTGRAYDRRAESPGGGSRGRLLAAIAFTVTR